VMTNKVGNFDHAVNSFDMSNIDDISTYINAHSTG
jgi:hypothetical protein